MEFFKGHGLGNDYLALDVADLPFEPSPPAARLLCDRHHGVGSDGVLGRVASAAADFGVRIWNPDGSEAEKSGNGLRIFAAYLLHLGAVAVGRAFTVETAGGIVGLRILSVTDDGVLDVEAEMGTASFRTADVGLLGEDREASGEPLELASGERVAIHPVSVGNPHCVIFQDELDPERLRRIAPEISAHPSFARGVNVQFAVPDGLASVDAFVWERGAGETSASGSSACAVAAASVRRGLVSAREVTVRMPGGALHVTVRQDWGLLLRGPVEAVYAGRLTDGMLARLRAVSF